MVKINGVGIDGRKVATIIKDQPGYSGDGSYMVAKATTGGYRLYKDVSGNWMDASLNDAPGLEAQLLATDSARALRAIPSEKRTAASAANGAKGDPESHRRGGRPRKEKPA
jgi:hypothetical protein